MLKKYFPKVSFRSFSAFRVLHRNLIFTRAVLRLELLFAVPMKNQPRIGKIKIQILKVFLFVFANVQWNMSEACN